MSASKSRKRSEPHKKEFCFLYWCKNNNKSCKENTHYFKFPSDCDRFEKWCEILELDSEAIQLKKSYTRICINHFKEEYIRTAACKTILRRDAIPFLPPDKISKNRTAMMNLRKTKTFGTQTDKSLLQTPESKVKFSEGITGLKRRLSAKKYLIPKFEQMLKDEEEQHIIDKKITKFLPRTDIPVAMAIYKRLTTPEKYSNTLSSFNIYYPDEVKKFAYKLHSISPEAYEILYGVFKDGLPHSSLVQDYEWQLNLTS